MADGSVTSLAAAPDGSIVITGAFSYINGQPRQQMARLLANGSLDPNWNPNTDGVIESVAVDDNGAIYIGGNFTQIGGVQRSYLAKLNTAGVVDTSWTPQLNGAVEHIVTHGTSVYIAGNFSYVGGAYTSFLARVAAASPGSVDANWVPDPNYYVNSIAIDDDGSIFIAGSFNYIGNVPHAGLAKLSTANGSVVVAWHADTYCQPNSIVSGHNGSVYAACGGPSVIGTQNVGAIAKLSAANGSVDTNWNPAPSSTVNGLASDHNGHIYASGGYNGGTIDSPFASELLAKIDSTGTGSISADWKTANAAIDTVRSDSRGGAIALTSSMVLVGGNFMRVGGQTRLGIAAFSPTADLLPPLDAGNPGTVRALLQQADGSVIVGGEFDLADVATPRHNILRLHPNGTLDDTWTPAFEGPITALAADIGALYVAGTFDHAVGFGQPGLTRLVGTNLDAVDPNWVPAQNSFLAQPGGIESIAVASSGVLFVGGRITAKVSANNGVIDHGWAPKQNSDVYAVTLDPAGNVVLAGYFYLVNNVRRNGFAKVSPIDGALDPNWDPAGDGWGTRLLRGSAGELYVGGNFTQLGGTARANIARVDIQNSGAVDPAWVPSTDVDNSGGVFALALSPSGDLFAGGIQIRNAQLSGEVVKYTPSGMTDSSWRPQPNGPVYAALVGQNGYLYIGGAFTEIGGVPRFGIAALPLTVPDEIFVDGFGL